MTIELRCSLDQYQRSIVHVSTFNPQYHGSAVINIADAARLIERLQPNLDKLRLAMLTCANKQVMSTARLFLAYPSHTRPPNRRVLIWAVRTCEEKHTGAKEARRQQGE